LYGARSSHIFLVHAPGHDRAGKLRVAAREQRAITRLRLERLLVEG
jgi:hypothetical protein